jgi:hypothetical protein
VNLLEIIFARCMPEPNSGCWLWLGALNTHGYGWMWRREIKRPEEAHRIVFRELHGSIPPRMGVLHHCDNRSCCNPDHLYLGSDADNARDRKRRGRNRHQTGEHNSFAKLTAVDVQSIRKSTARQIDIAAAFGITQTHVSRIKRGMVWQHII